MEYKISFKCDAEYLANMERFDRDIVSGGVRSEVSLSKIEEQDKKQPKIDIKTPNIVATDGRYGEEHKVKEVSLSFERDISIFYGRNRTGEHIAILPVKVVYRRK